MQYLVVFPFESVGSNQNVRLIIQMEVTPGSAEQYFPVVPFKLLKLNGGFNSIV